MRKTSRTLIVFGLTAALGTFAGATLANDPPRSTDTATNESDQPVTDTWITTKVKAELLAAKDVAGTDINVSTKDGVVTLAGVLDNKTSVDKAINVAKMVKGVRSVDTRALKSR